MFKCIVDSDIVIKLRELRHAEEIFQLIDQERDYLRKWLLWVDDTTEVADVEDSIEKSLIQFAESDGFIAGIWYKGALVGTISLLGISWKHKCTTIGYWLGSEFMGKGIMTKVCKAVIDYAFEELDLHRIEIQCAEGNKKSRAIPMRLGFVEEGILRDSEYLYDHFVNHVVYGVLRPDWERIHKNN